jgi:hypothetical protein
MLMDTRARGMRLKVQSSVVRTIFALRQQIPKFCGLSTIRIGLAVTDNFDRSNRLTRERAGDCLSMSPGFPVSEGQVGERWTAIATSI